MANVELAKAPERPPESRVHVPQPEPGVTPDIMVERARALIPMLRTQQDEADAIGHYTDEAHEAFRKAGFYRMLQPKMFGGYEFHFADYLRVVMEIGRGHPGAAWCFTLTSSHPLVVGAHFPEEVQKEIFGPEGDFRAPHRAPPGGTWTRVDGGYRVSGRWSYSSGVPVATHFLGGGKIDQGEGKPPKLTHFIVPRDKIDILPDWGGGATLGMEASGSNTVELIDVFVPDRHLFREDILVTSEGFGPGDGIGARIHGNPMYLGVVGGFFHATFGGIYVGAARAALDEFEQTARNTMAYRKQGVSRIDDPDAQVPFGQALTMTDCAEAITLQVAQMCMDQCARAVRTGQPITVADTMQVWDMARRACNMCCDAIELLFRTSPVRAANRGQKMQRYLRDAQMYRIHPSSQPWLDAARARAVWGMPINRYGH
jgi:3-hydroxy-9,10-secoandrosta-1,3,5(10)-triene-9,17-dione monooxygenase